jgi:hypothetical protein
MTSYENLDFSRFDWLILCLTIFYMILSQACKFCSITLIIRNFGLLFTLEALNIVFKEMFALVGCDVPKRLYEIFQITLSNTSFQLLSTFEVAHALQSIKNITILMFC